MAKHFVFSDTPSIFELTFAAGLTPNLGLTPVRVLSAINRHMPVTVAEVDSAGETFRLESNDLQAEHLFNTLRKSWPRISGKDTLSFALLFCPSGPSRGVWLVHLASARNKSRYSPGCHQVPSLS